MRSLVLTVALMLAGAAPGQAADPTPLSCDGKPVKFHVERSLHVIDKAHDFDRFLDATPAKANEKRAWRTHKICVLDQDRRHRIGAFVDKSRAAFDQHFEELLYPPGRATLEAIAECESGGDPTESSNSRYRGKYQFSYSTWASVGGSGDPAAAPEREQDYRASVLYEREGAAPWPVCGR
jgi:hypothetical protein